MRHLLILASLLVGAGATADDADFDFKSLGAKKALRDYKKTVSKDKKATELKRKELDEEAANLAKKTRDAFVESLKGALKQSMQAGNLDEANKISDAIKALDGEKLKPHVQSQMKDKQKSRLLIPRTKLALVKFLMGTTWLLAIEPKIEPDHKPKMMKFLSKDTVEMHWGEKVGWFPISARTLRITQGGWTRVVAFSPDFRSFELYVPHENNFVHGYRHETKMNNPPSRR